MHHLKTAVPLILILFTLAACDSTSIHVDASSPSTPELENFHVVDSYGDSTEFNRGLETVIDPLLNQGVFEVYWYANSFYDYWVTVAVNDIPSMDGSYVLSTELCGADLSCDYDGMQMCTYDTDATMGCGADLTEAEYNQTNIENLLFSTPEYLYLNIEVCDQDQWNCEVISREVSVY